MADVTQQLKREPDKKRHHYVPVSYLARFTDTDGFLYAYRKDEPDKTLRSRPEAIGFQTYYYSQPLPDGGYDHNRFENGLNELEAGWASLAAGLASRRNTNSPAEVSELLGHIALQKVRVPAARDLAEKALAHQVMRELRSLDAAGELPPKPEGLENLLDLIEVTIDPHKSIEAMAHLLPHLGPLLDSLGYQVLHNRTEVSLITSDNPVSYFDPSIAEGQMQPYRVVRPHRPMELLFPVDPWTVIRGHSADRERFARKGLKHVDVRNPEAIRRFNRLTARFAYELIFSCDTSHGGLARAYADQSPVLRNRVLADGSAILEHVFGPRQRKPKWRRPPPPVEPL